MTELSRLIGQSRRRLIAELRRTFEPHMWDSGFMVCDGSGARRPMKVWSPRDKGGAVTMVRLKGHVLDEFWGLSEQGVITDAYGGGCRTTPLSSFPLEDLILLTKWACKFVKPARTDGGEGKHGL